MRVAIIATSILISSFFNLAHASQKDGYLLRFNLKDGFSITKVSGQKQESISNQTVVDWTPYVKDMQDTCNTSQIKHILQVSYDENTNQLFYPNLPNYLRDSIVSYDSMEGKFVLQNAIAFGEPLVSISDSEMGDAEAVILNFADNNFMKLLPEFTISDGKRTEKAGTKHYWVNEVRYTFNSQNNDRITTILNSHTLPYYDYADEDFIFAYLSNYKEPRYYNKLSKEFKKYQETLINKINKKHHTKNKNVDSELDVRTLKTHEAGYDIRTSETAKGLTFNPEDKSISCSTYWYGENPFPSYFNFQ